MSHPPEGISLYPQTGIIFQFYFDGYVMEFVPFRVFFSYTKMKNIVKKARLIHLKI